MSDNLDLTYAQVVNISIPENTTFALSLYVKNDQDQPIDLTTSRAQFIVVESNLNRNLIAEMTETDGIVMGNGSIGFKKNLNIVKGRYYYFLKIIGAENFTENWLEGAFIVK